MAHQDTEPLSRYLQAPAVFEYIPLRSSLYTSTGSLDQASEASQSAGSSAELFASKSTSSSSSTVFSTSIQSRSSLASSVSFFDQEGLPTLETQIQNMSLPESEAFLPCLFSLLTGCPGEFHLDDVDNWRKHDLYHFGKSELPNEAMCIFCEKVFKHVDPDQRWSERMEHIAKHFEHGRSIEDSRPDFSLIHHLRKKNLITESVYNDCMAYNERPTFKGADFRPLDWKPDKMREQEEAEKRNENNLIVFERRRHREPKDSMNRPKKTSSKTHKVKISRE